jgi:hypothetical protein
MKNKFAASRRSFLKHSLVIAGTPLVLNPKNILLDLSSDTSQAYRAPLNWLQKGNKTEAGGVTWGTPWPKGKLKPGTSFYLANGQGEKRPLQSWPLAYWPDGTLKWTGHAAAPGLSDNSDYAVVAGKTVEASQKIKITELASEISIDTGKINCVVNKTGNLLIKNITIKDKVVAKDGKLVLILQNHADDDLDVIKKSKLQGVISSVQVEQAGPLRAVLKITGSHTNQSLKLLPFIVRLYFYVNSDEIRLLYTLIYDADEQTQFIKGLGIALDVPLNDEPHNRHIRFINSEANGVFAEAVQGLSGLRKDPGQQIINAQLDGKLTPAADELPEQVKKYLKYVPKFGDYTLFQGDSSGFTIKKRTAPGYSWLASANGNRASGTVYLGTPHGGVVAGVRNFWQSFPGQLDIRNAATDTGTINLWLWAPDAPAMDLRFYHDGMGQDTYAKQRDGLEITYEDYEPGFGTPHGVARTSELVIKAVEATPSRDELVKIASDIQTPSRLICDNTYLQQEKVFGGNWSLEDRSNPAKESLEQQLQTYFDYYKKQVDYHNWYGYWNYGDFMHTYDKDRHTWRYDVGGFAWDNSELSTDLWLWYYYLKTQRADVFQVAEAMTRHTGEVDVHHIGRFAPLGSRHNVMHWGCSAKQLRISTAANRRFYYYLTADERVGDLLKEQVDAARTLSRIQPNRKLDNIRDTKQPEYTENKIPASFGTDYGAIAAAWLTEWERTANPVIKNKLINSMKTIAAQPHGFFTGGGTVHLDTGKFEISSSNELNVSHLNAVFGLTEIVEELINLVDEPAFTKAWLQYCRLYNATSEEQQQELGQALKKLNLGQGHSRLTAYAAFYNKDKKLAARAWNEFYSGKAGIVPGKINIQKVNGPLVLNPVEEDLTISTNAVAQWGLAAIQCLAYIGNEIPA